MFFPKHNSLHGLIFGFYLLKLCGFLHDVIFKKVQHEYLTLLPLYFDSSFTKLVTSTDFENYKVTCQN